MLIGGIGVDIVDVGRIEDILRLPFAKKILSQEEYESISDQQKKDPLYLTFVFAAKEAVVKAMGTGFLGIFFQDITVYLDCDHPYAKVKNSKTEKSIIYFLSFEYIIPEYRNKKFMIICKCIACIVDNSNTNINVFGKRELHCLTVSQNISFNRDYNKLLSDEEENFSCQSKAVNIAAKKAMLSFFDISNSNLFKQISVTRSKTGKPYFLVSNEELNDRLKKYNTFLSLSHEKNTAVAFLVFQHKEEYFYE